MPDLTIRDLTVEYSSGGYAVRPLDGFDLDVPAGSLAILLGPSGCGKTTLLSCLGGMLTPRSGSIRFGDREVTGMQNSALAAYRREVVGFVFQGFNLVPSLTARENVMVPLRAAGASRGQARRHAEELLTRVGLDERMHHRPGDMSGGQQQRVAIARALANNPPLLVADEPTANLDFIMVEDVLRLIRDLASGDRVVVVATHDDRMIPLADQVVEMVPRFRVESREPERVVVLPTETLFRQGDPSDLIYVIEEGAVDIVRELADGGEEHRATLGSGDYFGEIGPFFGLPRSATVRATDAGAVVVGYTMRDFRDRVGPEGIRGLLQHAPLEATTAPEIA